MVMKTISSKFQIVIPTDLRDKLHLRPKQRLHVMVKDGIITLVPDVLFKSLKGMSKTDLREKKYWS